MKTAVIIGISGRKVDAGEPAFSLSVTQNIVVGICLEA